MRTYRIPRTDFAVSRLAYGVGMLRNDWNADGFIERSVRAIRTARDCGVTLFDTADVYAGGQSEVALGRVLRESKGLRQQIVIQTKCGLQLQRDWNPSRPIDPGSIVPNLSRARIVSAVEGSLRRLNTDRLDILLLHSPSPLVEPQEIAAAFEELGGSGKVLHFGVCGHSAAQIELLKKYVRQQLIANQIWLGLAHHAPISELSGFGSLVDYCRAHEIQVQAFSPLKGGDIFGKPLLLQPPADAAPQVRRLAAMLVDLGERYGVSAAAIMLAWLLRHPAGIVPLIGASSREHIEEACAADRIELDREQWHALYSVAATLQ
jgi:predicted oxidoreductase